MAKVVEGKQTLEETLKERGVDSLLTIKKKGVSFDKRNKRWLARMPKDGKDSRKYFPVKRYRTEGMGFADAFRLAHEAALKHRGTGCA